MLNQGLVIVGLCMLVACNSEYQDEETGAAKEDSSLLGPYLDRLGNDLRDGTYGEILLIGDDGGAGFAGPGHNAEIITDDEGRDWLHYHAMRKEKPKLDNVTNRRSLRLDRIRRVAGWPQVEGRRPSVSPAPGPYFENKGT